jgi:excisionase family DNA binding protein
VVNDFDRARPAARLTTQEAADLIGMSRHTLWVRLRADGEISYEQRGSHRRILGLFREARLRERSSRVGVGDVDGAYAAAYDAYRVAAKGLLGRHGLRATGGDGSHMAVEDAVSAGQ